MQVKNSSNTKTYFFIAFALLFLMVSGLLLSGNFSQTKSLVNKVLAKENEATEIPTANNIAQLIEMDDSYLYKDENLYVFAMQDLVIPQIIYAYKTPLNYREKTDKFYIKINVKDSIKHKNAFFDILFKDPISSEKIVVHGEEYQIFVKELRNRSFKGGVIPFKEIEHISVVRFTKEKGRSFDSKELVIADSLIHINKPKIAIEEGDNDNVPLVIKTINVYAKESNFAKIKKKRDEALDKGILLAEDGDFINGSIAEEDKEKVNVEFRLKGDWIDHLSGKNQWSYRFVTKGDKTFLGMRKFSLQHPKTRNFHWEWFFNKVVKDQGIIGLRYDFVFFNRHIAKDDGVEVIDNKIMALEESFDKILIENNKKREGVIIAFDESDIWKDRQYASSLNLDDYPRVGNRGSSASAKIRVYNQNKVLKNPELKKQFLIAKDLLDGVRQGTYKTSEVFDIDKLTLYVALCNVFGGQHGLIWHNIRVYYNPITNKLEPISFDSQGGVKIDAIKHYPFSEEDPVYLEKLAEKIKLVSSQKFIDEFLSKYSNDINTLTEVFEVVYPEYNFDINILAYNSNVLKKLMFPVNLVQADVVSFSKNKLTLEINNYNEFSVTIKSLTDLEGKKLSLDRDTIVTLKRNEKRVVDIALRGAFENAFVSKKSKKAGFVYPNDVAKLRITGVIDGVGYLYADEIGVAATNQNLEEDTALYRKAHSVNYSDFAFIKEGKSSNQIVFKKGSYTLSKNLKIPKGKTVLIEAGFQLDFTNNASILSKSTILANGTEREPITFLSKDATGRGIFVDGAENKSVLMYCIFDNLSNPLNEFWSVSGAVNFHESEVAISHCTFSNNRCEDALNVIRTNFEMSNTTFISTYSDSFDGDFVTGTISNCKFSNSGNDAIDISGSQLILRDILIENPLDKGISAGEASRINGSNIIINEGEIGIVSKDLSQVILNNVSINNTRLGLSAFQKKSEYGKASIAITGLIKFETDTKYLIENGCKLTIDSELMPTVSNKVIDQMYGAEYGKSSK